jgi:HlyD family secretion protein
VTRVTWLGIASGAIVLAGVAARTFHAAPEIVVDRALVSSGPISRRVVATGTVQASTTVDVGTQVSGVVQSLDVDYNSFVRAGQVVARLEPSLYQAALERAKAGLSEATAAFNQAQADLNGLRTAQEDARTKLTRAKALASRQLLAPADLDAAQIAMDEADADVRSGEARVNQARAAIAAARADVDQASVDLDHTVLHSPIDGIVIARNVDVGQTLAASIQAPVLFRIASDLRHVQVQADIDESDVDGLATGDTATFEVESFPGESFTGTVSQLRLEPVAEQTATATSVGASSVSAPTSSVVATVVGYTIVIDVPNPDERLRPGMTAEVILTGARRASAVRIPNGALAFVPPADVLHAGGEAAVNVSTTGDEGSAGEAAAPRRVWTYDGKRFTPIAVRVGLADEQFTELLSGSVHPGDALVTNAMLRVGHRL